ncbi:hypothetical protein [Kribbella sp. NPDC050470]|uniref:hypothetical protein n=1 Tax=unclassified Kribbella TaxID=2644121 RepID=UPI0037B75ECC
MAVKVRLEGHGFDLDTLADLFGYGEPMVSSDADGYYLAASSLDGLFEDGGRLRDAAEVILRRANGVARSLTDGYRPVRLTGRFTSGDGKHQHVMVLGTAEERSRALPMTFVVNGEPQQQPPPSPAPAYLEAAETHPDVGEVLDLLGKDVVGLDWFDLYKVYEIVRGDVGTEAALLATGWVPATDLKAFTASANLPTVSGADARHARGPTGQPKHTMTLHQARSMIGQLVAAWLDSL